MGNRPEWIDAYGATAWEKSDAKVFVDLIEDYMEQATEQLREAMKQAYQRAATFEYLFWDTVDPSPGQSPQQSQ